jgi:hypothetical protein
MHFFGTKTPATILCRVVLIFALCQNGCREEILEKVAQNRVVIVAGDTGCGKSTQVPFPEIRASVSEHFSTNYKRPLLRLVLMMQLRRVRDKIAPAQTKSRLNRITTHESAQVIQIAKASLYGK